MKVWTRFMKQPYKPELPEENKWCWRRWFHDVYCPGNTRHAVQKALADFGGRFQAYDFVEHGLTTWSIADNH